MSFDTVQIIDNSDLKIKDHSVVNLYDPNDCLNEKYLNLTKIDLVKITKSFGLIIVAFKNNLKILTIDKVESTNGKQLGINDVPFVAQLDLNDNEIITSLHLNYENRILIALSLKESQLEQYLNAFNLDTLATNQFPQIIKRVRLNQPGDVNTLVYDFCFSPSEKDLFAVCTRGGMVKLWRLSENEAKLSKNLNAACVCWSPKGKLLAICSRDHQIVQLEIANLDEKIRFKLTTRDSIPNDIYWHSTKQYFITFMNPNDKRTEISLVEASPKDPANIKILSYDDLIFETDNKPNENSMSFFESIAEWNLILFVTSKCTELGLLEKGDNDVYRIQMLDDTSRATLPLRRENDTYPLGLAISLNTQNQIDIKPHGKIQPTPLIAILNNYGQLVTYYICNLKSKDKSICAPPTAKYAPTSGLLTATKIQTSSKVQAPIVIQPAPSQTQLFGQSQPPLKPNQGGVLNLSSSTSNFSITPSPSAMSFNDVSMKSGFGTTSSGFGQTPPPVFNTGVQAPSFMQKQSQPLAFSFNTTQSVPANLNQMSQPIDQPKVNLAPLVNQLPPQALQKSQQPILPYIQPQVETPQIVAQKTELIDQFNRELSELRDKFHSYKHLQKDHLQSNLAIKVSRLTESFAVINADMKEFGEKCVELRENLISNFDFLKKLEVLKEHLNDKKYMDLLYKRELDPNTKRRVKEVHRLYAYLNDELRNLEMIISEKSKIKRERLADFIPSERVFETLRVIESNINICNRHVNQLIASIKSKNLLSKKNECFNLMLSPCADSNETFERLQVDVKNLTLNKTRDELLSYQQQQQQPKTSNQFFYTQLYELLKQRKKIPQQSINIRRIELVKTKFDDSKATRLQSSNDFSFVKIDKAIVNEQSPTPAQTIVIQTPTHSKLNDNGLTSTPLVKSFNLQTQQLKPQFTQKAHEQINQSITLPSQSMPNFGAITSTAPILVGLPSVPAKGDVSMSSALSQVLSDDKSAFKSILPPGDTSTMTTSKPTISFGASKEPAKSLVSQSTTTNQSSQRTDESSKTTSLPGSNSSQNLNNSFSFSLQKTSSNDLTKVTSALSPSTVVSEMKPSLSGLSNFSTASDESKNRASIEPVKTTAPPVIMSTTNTSKPQAGFSFGTALGTSTFTFSNSASALAKPESSTSISSSASSTNLFGQKSSFGFTSSPRDETITTTSQPVFQFTPASIDNKPSTANSTSATSTTTVSKIPVFSSSSTSTIASITPSNTTVTKPLFGTVTPNTSSQSSVGSIATNTDLIKTSTPAVNASSGLFNTATSSTTTLSVPTIVTTTTTTTSSLFGQSTPSIGGNNLFGQLQPTSSSTISTKPSLFGVTATTASTTQSSLFGSTNSTASDAPKTLFGQSVTATTPNDATKPISKSTTADSEPPKPSLGQPTTTENSKSFFGQSSTIEPPKSLFGQSSTTEPSKSLFGQSSTTEPSKSLFGPSAGTIEAPKSDFSTTSSNSNSSSTPNLFASLNANASKTTAASLFGSTTSTTSTTTAPSFFQSSGFGSTPVTKTLDENNMEANATSAAPSFGFGGLSFGEKSNTDQNKENKPFSFGGTSAFGQAVAETTTTQSSGLIKGSTFTFGNHQTTAPSGGFGSFGGSAQIANQPSFGTSATAQPSGGLFSSFSSTNKPAFGGTPAFGTAPVFGSTPAFGSAPTFGSPLAATNQSTANQQPLFGQSTANQQPLFGQSTTQSTGTFGFGTFGSTSNSDGLTFNTLAQTGQAQLQQAPTGSLFSSFGSPPSANQPFGQQNSNLGSSFTSYRK